jgi:hypothetical protein
VVSVVEGECLLQSKQVLGAVATYYVSLTATSVDDEEPQLLNQEIDCRRGVSLDEVLAVIKNGLTGSA